jgi:hypothetical protein
VSGGLKNAKEIQVELLQLHYLECGDMEGVPNWIIKSRLLYHF